MVVYNFWVITLTLAVLISQSSSIIDGKDGVDLAEKAALSAEKLLEMLGKDGYNVDKLKGFVNGVMPFVKTLGPAFALISMLIDKNDTITEEMKKNFDQVNMKLDNLGTKMQEMQTVIETEIQKLQYNTERRKLGQVDGNRKLYKGYPTATSLQRLRKQCDATEPENFIFDVHQMSTIPAISGDFLGTIFKSVAYSYKAWKVWSATIVSDLVNATSLQEVCNGVHKNPDGSNLTNQEIEYWTDVYKTNYTDKVIEILEEKAVIIQNNWSEMQLTIDIENVMTEQGGIGGQTEQQVAEAVYDKLHAKYPEVFFGVHVFENTDKKVSKIFQTRNAKIVLHEKSNRIAVVNWQVRAKLSSGQVAQQVSKVANEANEAASQFPCEYASNIGKYRTEFFNHLLVKYPDKFNEKYFTIIYGIIYEAPRRGSKKIGKIGKIGFKYDKENTYVYKVDHCEKMWHAGPPFEITSIYETYVIFGF